MKKIIYALCLLCTIQISYPAQITHTQSHDVTNSPTQASNNQNLINAAFKGDVTEIIAALKAGAFVDAQDENGLTALMWSAQKGHLEAIPILVTAGADLLAEDDNGYTAFVHANNDKVTALLFDLVQEKLFQAAADGDVKTVTRLIEGGMEVDTKNLAGMTLLMFAAQENQEEVVGQLIFLGANVNARDYAGGTPIRYAINNPSLIGDLLRAGANVSLELKTMAKFNPKIRETIAPYIQMTQEAFIEDFMQAAMHGDTDISSIGEFIFRGININSTDKGGWSALDWAAFSNQPKTVSFLLRSGAIPSKISYEIAEKNAQIKDLLDKYAQTKQAWQ